MFQENTKRVAFETLAGLLEHVSPSVTYLPFLSLRVTDTVNMLMMPEALWDFGFLSETQTHSSKKMALLNITDWSKQRFWTKRHKCLKTLLKAEGLALWLCFFFVLFFDSFCSILIGSCKQAPLCDTGLCRSQLVSDYQVTWLTAAFKKIDLVSASVAVEVYGRCCCRSQRWSQGLLLNRMNRELCVWLTHKTELMFGFVISECQSGPAAKLFLSAETNIWFDTQTNSNLFFIMFLTAPK